MNLKEANEQTLISCGSWVSFSLRNNGNLKKVIIIGPSSLTIHSNDCSYVEVFPIDISHEVSIHTILSHIHTETIYVSIDKDVLDPKVTITNWDQGHMKLSILLQFIHSLITNKSIYGIDICGELPVYPSQLFLPKYKNAIQKNEQANLQILKQFIKRTYIFNTHKKNEYLTGTRSFYARFSFNHFVIVSNLETSKRLSLHTCKLFKLFTISNSFDFTLFASINLQYPSVTVFKFS